MFYFTKFKAGIGLTVLTGGVAGAILGGAYLGMGGAAVATPVTKICKGEMINGEEFAHDMLIGTGLGAVTAPISVAGGGIASVSSTVAEATAVRMGTGAVSGAVSGSACSALDPDSTFGSVMKSTAFGAAIGAATGGVSQISASITDQMTGEVSKAATRIGVNAVTSGGIDVGTQLITEGEVDPKRVIATMTTGVALGAICEGTSAGARRTNLYAECRNNERIEKGVTDPNQQERIQNILVDMNAEESREIKSLPKGAQIRIAENAISQEKSDFFAQKVNGKLYYQENINDTVPKSIENPFSGKRPRRTHTFKPKPKEEEE